MISTVEQAHIDSQTFPHTYSLINNVRGIATHFRTPAADLLQELMLSEFLIQKEKKPIRDIRCYLLKSVYQNALQRYLISKSRDKVNRETISSYSIDVNRQELFHKLFLDELITILQDLDSELCSIVQTALERGIGSWRELYHSTYRSQGLTIWEYYKRVDVIKRVARSLRDKSRFDLLDKKGFRGVL